MMETAVRTPLSLAHELRLVGVALQFLTRIPVPMRRFDPSWLHESARHFPLVGALVGVIGAAGLWVASWWWPAPVAVLISMALTVWLTGGFHEDGLADTCDGLGGAVSRERALEIMKDSRLGSYGALGLLLTLTLKGTAICALAGVSVPLACTAIVLAHAASRAAAVGLMAALPYGGDAAHAKAKPPVLRVGVGSLVVAIVWALLVAGALAWATNDAGPIAVSLAGVCVVALVCARWFRRRLGGYTGDTLGAAQQWCEVAVYLALAAAMHG